MDIIIWSVLLCFAILVTVITVSLFYRRKYDPVFRQLTELLAKQERVVENKTSRKPVRETARATERPADRPAHIAEKAPRQETPYNQDADLDLFKRLTDAIRSEQLYTAPKFGRKELVAHFRLSNRQVSAMFSAAGTSVPEFIRECRLEHARRLIAERPDLTLSEIAAASGFVHASTFTVDFKNKFGTSPTQYREQCAQKS